MHIFKRLYLLNYFVMIKTQNIFTEKQM